MLNLGETVLTIKRYNQQSAIVFKLFFWTFPTVFFLEYLSLQVPEIKLLQLLPGLIISLLFSLFCFLLFISSFLLKLFTENDLVRYRGTKTFLRFSCKSTLKMIFLVFFIGTYALFNEIVPLSFESFEVAAESNGPSLWSINEFIGIEKSLGCLLAFASCFPFFLFSTPFSIKEIRVFPNFQRNYIFSVCVLAGVLTPTVDAATQINFIIIGITFYFLVNSFLKKASFRRKLN